MAAISVGQIEAVATLKDDLTGKMSGIRKGVLAASAAIGAAGLKAGADWDKAKATIAKGTGATGKALDGLTASYRKLAGTVTGDVASAIADLNTHTGLTGKALEDLATKALKAGVDTNAFGSTVRQMGLDGAGAAKLLDQLTKVSQDTGVSVEELTLRVGRNAKRFQDAGGTMSAARGRGGGYGVRVRPAGPCREHGRNHEGREPGRHPVCPDPRRAPGGRDGDRRGAPMRPASRLRTGSDCSRSACPP